MLGTILSIVVSGFLVGGAARFAVPGPDPMGFWLTVLVGFAGSIVGGGIAAAIFGARDALATSNHVFVTLLLEIGVAALIVLGFRSRRRSG